MIKIEIDKDSGFCFGVVNAINSAEKELLNGGTLYCLGDIVHNSREVDRLKEKGLVTIDHSKYEALKGVKVLLRAHGEPPETYELAKSNGIRIIDATCPVVLQLQKKIKRMYCDSNERNSQIVIFGKNGHAEVNGLVGQTNGNAIVIEKIEDVDKIDFTKDIRLFSQTTKSISHFHEIISELEKRSKEAGVDFKYFDTICRQVSNRMSHIRNFAKTHDILLFVSGEKSSNGKVLFEECTKVNKASYLISDETQIDKSWLNGASSIGICGATSTPKWLMEKVAEYINSIANQAD
ncbi:MAG: 4-hydroxy-3-methylbut-2-enyl diphosphate reductase [Bacteroidales bacterium]|nr:4-hydroxy-3-methylbut-2-enyl diphosphate reductase [Bacteroidales bacterium]